MSTARLPTVPASCFSDHPPDATPVGAGGGQLNNEDHQMPLAGAGYVQEGDAYSRRWRGGYV